MFIIYDFRKSELPENGEVHTRKGEVTVRVVHFDRTYPLPTTDEIGVHERTDSSVFLVVIMC